MKIITISILAILLSALSATASLERADEATATLGDEVPWELFNEEGYVWEEKDISNIHFNEGPTSRVPIIIIYEGSYYMESKNKYIRYPIPLLGEEGLAKENCNLVMYGITNDKFGRNFYFIESEGGWNGWVDENCFLPARAIGGEEADYDIENTRLLSIYGHLPNLYTGTQYPSHIVKIIVDKILAAPELRYTGGDHLLSKPIPENLDMPTYQSQALCWGGLRLMDGDYSYITDYGSEYSLRLLREFGNALCNDYRDSIVFDLSPFTFESTGIAEGIRMIRAGYTKLGLGPEFDEYIKELKRGRNTYDKPEQRDDGYIEDGIKYFDPIYSDN